MDERIKRLRQAIEKSGLTYAELGKITGIAKSSLQRYATGATKKIPIDNIEAIAQATGVSAKYLLCWDEEKWRIAPELNEGYPIPPGSHYARMKDNNLLLAQKRKQAIDKVTLIPLLNIDKISKFAFDESLGFCYDFAPLAFFDKQNEHYIYVANKSKYDEFKDRMYPLIEENDIILLDFGKEAKNGDLVMIEFCPGKNFFCRFYKYDDFIEFQFSSHKPVRINCNDRCYSRYEVRGVVKQIIKNL